MGSSVKLGCADTKGDELKIIMLEKFGFSEADDLLVEFFDDSFDNIIGAVENLVKTMIAVKRLAGSRQASTFICFTGRHFTTISHSPEPEDLVKFWSVLHVWLSENTDEGAFEWLRPTIMIPTPSCTISNRIQGYMRDYDSLKLLWLCSLYLGIRC